MYKIVMVRHGQSQWNLENRFTGWTNIDLSEQGRAEAKNCGILLREVGFVFDQAYTSVLDRAIRTLWIIQEEMDSMFIPVANSWRLNERHYGALQGLNKAETAEKYGAEQVHIWRRSYDVQPPALTEDDERNAKNDRRYQDLESADIPLCESLKDTEARMLPYWHEVIAPAVKSGKQIIIAAHGNSIRSLVKYLDNIPNDKIMEVEIPTGKPLVYELDEDLKPIRSYYLGE